MKIGEKYKDFGTIIAIYYIRECTAIICDDGKNLYAFIIEEDNNE